MGKSPQENRTRSSLEHSAGVPDAVSPELASGNLEALARCEVREPLRVGPGRVTFVWTDSAGRACIVKRYAGQRLAESLRERLAGRDPRSPARREYEALLELSAVGVRVPRAVALHEQDGLSLVVMERLEPLVSLREVLTADPARASELLQPTLELVRRFHRAGWYHRDLYLDHLVLAGERGQLALIDLERARRDARPRRRWFIKDLAALWHSTPRGVDTRVALRFVAAWLDGHGVRGRRRRRQWLRAIQAKARRMAAHVPRGGTSFPVQDS